VKVFDIIDAEAVELLAEKLRTPLQLEMHFELAFEATFRAGAKPTEIRIFLAGTLEAERACELADQMRAAGVPL
jgi:hypothetical protein